MFPKARADKLTVRELAEETLIYDQERHKAHCLNATAQMVWRRCDGKTAVDAIARIVAAELGIGNAGDVVRLALDQLARRHLLDEPTPLPRNSSMTRRKALKKLALAAVALPLVMTIATKTAAQSMSGGGGSSAPSNGRHRS